MLKELLITNLALIEKLHVSFAEGLSVFTGETGAGKSIILQAIHLLAGGKAAASWVRSGEDSATVEALFALGPRQEEVAVKLDEMGFAAEGELVVKRIVSLKGTSRYYLNGSLANARMVGEVMEHLISVASQHDHQQLLQPKSHLDFLDAAAGLLPRRLEVSRLYDRWLAARGAYQELVAKERDKEQRRDFLAFQIAEIAEAALQPDEDAALVAERDRLRGADELIAQGRKTCQLLAEAAGPLAVVRKNLQQMAAVDQSLAGLAEETAGSFFQLEDQLATLRSYVDRLGCDPARLDEVTARLDLLQRLKRKYGGELPQIIAFAEEAGQELAEIEALDARLTWLEKELAQAEAELVAAAAGLSRARIAAAEELAGKIRGALASLCFEQALFEISFKNDREEGLSGISRLGWDRPEFMFSANPGEALKPLSQVASGGELSRLMLALKSILARQDQVATVIFDEIDAGISGKAAEAVARKIRELSAHHQVLCITHLPQIACLADVHFLVKKAVSEARTRTGISPLPGEELAAELARMLDGDLAGEETFAYVRSLLDRREAR